MFAYQRIGEAEPDLRERLQPGEVPGQLEFPAVERAQRLVEALVRMDANLAALRRLKAALGGPPPTS